MMPPRSNSFNHLGMLSNQGAGMTRAQSLGSSLGSFGQYERPGRPSNAYENMRKVRSQLTIHGTLSEMGEADELQRLRSEVRDLDRKLKSDQTNSNDGPFASFCWYLAITTNLLLAGKVFSTKFFEYMKQDLRLRTVTARVVGQYVRRAVKVAGPKARGRGKRDRGLSFSTLYSGYNRDGLMAAGWSSPFLLFAFVIFKRQMYNIQGWAVVASCLYSGAIPALTNGSNVVLCRLNIVASALYFLTRWYTLISPYEHIVVR